MTSKLLVQADDYGFTKGVTYGILDSIKNGILRNTGIFCSVPNFPYAASLMKDYPEACFGIDFNMVAGPCISDPKTIPNLVDENGNYIRSSVRIKDPRYQTEEGRAQMTPADEVKREVRAHYDRFLEFTGHKPGYFQGHSWGTEVTRAAIAELAKEEGLHFGTINRGDFHSPMAQRGGIASRQKVFDPMEQMNLNPEEYFWKVKDEILEHEFNAIVVHPGFVDYPLFDWSTLILERCRDHQFLTSPRVVDWIKQNNVELITYRDLPLPY